MGFNQSQGHIWFQDRKWKSNKLSVIHNLGQISIFYRKFQLTTAVATFTLNLSPDNDIHHTTGTELDLQTQNKNLGDH